jgi:hypothetical protein
MDNPMVFTLKQLEKQPQTGRKDGSWHPSRPVSWSGMKLWNRIGAAWLVLCNRAIVVRWY